MVYNTRRKSIPLELLGIHVPKDSPRVSHNRTPPAALPSVTEEQHPPTKRVKRSHTVSSAPSPSPKASHARRYSVKVQGERPKSSGRVVEQHTPPPSPGAESAGARTGTEGIDDDIVVGVIEQLEKTGNRPHLLKELAATLASTLPAVGSSANPAAIISSRLTNFLRRPWSPASRCPLDKVLVGTHPKRVYYFLTNRPHQPIVEPTAAAAAAIAPPVASRIISPSLSSAADEEEQEERDARSRMQLSPSPEVDLSSPELDDEGRNPFQSPGHDHRDHPHHRANMAGRDGSHPGGAAPPNVALTPLERDEREFTQTFNSLQRRSRSHDQAGPQPPAEADAKAPGSAGTDDFVSIKVEAGDDDTEEGAARRNREAAAALFGQANGHLAVVGPQPGFGSSPIIKPQRDESVGPALKRAATPAPLSRAPSVAPEDDVRMTDAIDTLDWEALKSPENVELDELDDLLGGY